MLADPADGSTLWETDYNALITGLTVTDSMALVLADNPGLAMSEVQLANPDGTVTTEQTNPYPEQTSPQIYGYFLDTGLTFQEPEDPTAYNAHGKTWISDAGTLPFVSLTEGPDGPIAISESGRLTFFGLENPLVQAVVDLPGALPNQVSADDAAVYVSLENGSVTAIAPVLVPQEPQDVSPTPNIDWTMPLAGSLVDFGGMAYGEGLVYRLIDAGAGPQIEVTFASTGQSSWTLRFDWSTAQIVADTGPTDYLPNGVRSGSGNIFAVDAENRLFALAGTSGTVNWQIDFEQPVVSMLLDNETLYVWDESGTMTALNSADGSTLWSTSSGSTGGSQSNELGMPIPVATSTVVTMVDAQGALHGFDRTSGELLWSTPGFDGTNTRLVHQGPADAGQQEWFVALTAHGEPDANGNFEQVLSGVLAQTGERRWDDYISGPLVPPVATNETMVFAIGNEGMTGKAVTPSDPIVDGESHNYYVWTGTGEAAPAGGGERLFAFDVDTGQIVWIRTTAAGGFTSLSTTFPNSGSLTAVTTDGLLVRPARDNGSIDGEPAQLGGPVIAILSSGETGAIGSFATLADGTLVAFGGIPFSQQG
jgi:outer membrane protein assembly factor BamB